VGGKAEARQPRGCRALGIREVLRRTIEPMSLPSVLLRLEGAGLLRIAAFLYARSDTSWLLFALLFLAPDVGMVGYLGGAGPVPCCTICSTRPCSPRAWR
jgi:hypothetical protein